MPSSRLRTDDRKFPMNEALERFLPVYGHGEVHRIRLAVPPERAWEALCAVTEADLPLPRALMAVRTLPADFIRRYFDSWSFRAYCGPNPKARRSTTDGDDEVAFAKQRARDLSKWLVVADEVYDSGALEIWSLKLDSHQLSGRLPLPEINDLLALVDLKAYLPG